MKTNCMFCDQFYFSPFVSDPHCHCAECVDEPTIGCHKGHWDFNCFDNVPEYIAAMLSAADCPDFGEKEKPIHAGQVVAHIGQRAAVAIPAITAEQVRARIAEIKAERPLSDEERSAILEFLCNAPVAGTVEETDG